MVPRYRDAQGKPGVFGHRNLGGPAAAGGTAHPVGAHKFSLQQFGQVLVHGRHAQPQVIRHLLLGMPLRRIVQIAIQPVPGDPSPFGGGLI